MTGEECIKKIRDIFAKEPLNDIQELVFKMCWEGKTYAEISTVSRYEESYIRDVGSKLWKRLSNELNIKISKSNLHVALSENFNKRDNTFIPKKTTSIIRSQVNNQSLSTSSIYQFESPHIEFPSGLVPLNSPFYICRPPCEQIACQQIKNPGSLLQIKAPQKMGKSSLLIRILNSAAEQNYQTVCIDFKQIDVESLQHIDTLLRWFCMNVKSQLNKLSKIDEIWDLELGSKVSCSLYLQSYILDLLDTPVVIAFNDIDRLYNYPQIAQDFFSLLRYWHEQANQIEVWQKLRSIVVYATDNYISLDINQSPFNVGLTVKLPTFSLQQVNSLAVSYGLNKFEWELTKKFIARLHEIVGGHPYLIRLAFYHLTQNKENFEELLSLAATEQGIYSNYLRSLAIAIAKKPRLKTALIKLVIAKDSIKLDTDIAYQLESLGLIERQRNLVRLSCELYRMYFRDVLIANSNLHDLSF